MIGSVIWHDPDLGAKMSALEASLLSLGPQMVVQVNNWWSMGRAGLCSQCCEKVPKCLASRPQVSAVGPFGKEGQNLSLSYHPSSKVLCEAGRDSRKIVLMLLLGI
jgi:hypothetical protein